MLREFVEPRPRALLTGGVLLCLPGSGCIAAHVADSADVGWIMCVIGAVLLVVYAFTKPKFWVRIGTAGAEANAVWSNEAQWTRTVVAAINQAIVTRG